MVGLTDLLSEPVRKREDLTNSPVAPKAVQSTQYTNQLPVADQAIQLETPFTQYTDQLPGADQAIQPETPFAQYTDQLPVVDQAIQPENPFTLTDAEVEEVLRGLEETFTAAEVEELLGGLGETSTTDESDGTLQGHYIDNEVDGVLDMCVEDYIV